MDARGLSIEERALEAALVMAVPFLRLDLTYDGRCCAWFADPTPFTPATLAKRLDRSGLAQAVGYGWRVQEGECYVRYIVRS